MCWSHEWLEVVHLYFHIAWDKVLIAEKVRGGCRHLFNSSRTHALDLLNYQILPLPFQFFSFRLSLVFLVTRIWLLTLGLDWAGAICPLYSSWKLCEPQRFLFLCAEDQFKSLVSSCELNFALPSGLSILFCRWLHVCRQFEQLGIKVLQLMLLEGFFPALSSYMDDSNICQLCKGELLNWITLWCLSLCLPISNAICIWSHLNHGKKAHVEIDGTKMCWVFSVGLWGVD